MGISERPAEKLNRSRILRLDDGTLPLAAPTEKLEAACLDHLIEAGKRVVVVITSHGNRVDACLA